MHWHLSNGMHVQSKQDPSGVTPNMKVNILYKVFNAKMSFGAMVILEKFGS